MLKILRFTVAAVLLAGAVSGCSVGRFVFGEPYDWNNPPGGHPPSKEARKACNVACDNGGDRSDRNDAMCHFACVSSGDPWYSAHVVVDGITLLRQDHDSPVWRSDFTACYDARLRGEATKTLLLDATEGCAEGVKFFDDRISLPDYGYPIHWPPIPPGGGR